MAGTLGGEHRQHLTVVTACCDMLVACDLAGDLRRAVQWCQVADRFIDRYGCPFLYARCRTLYGGVLVAKGRWPEAEAELRAAVRMAEGAGPASHAEALARLAELAEGDGEGQVAAMAAQAAARVAAVEGRPEEARRLLERALELFSSNDLPHETALARVELAHALTGVNPELAVAEARTALGAFERLGAAGDADAADALLRSLGATGRTGPKRIGVLTRREQEVLRLVGLGLSNPEIAQRLFISRKTAAHHVSNVLAKLGVRNRAGAIAYATRQQDRG
jgi:DNA-binding NarL/FixJ family response regulator